MNNNVFPHKQTPDDSMYKFIYAQKALDDNCIKYNKSIDKNERWWKELFKTVQLIVFVNLGQIKIFIKMRC